MIRAIRHIKILLLVCLAGSLTACYDVEEDRGICDYDVVLRYDYNEENKSQGRNMIEFYVGHIDEYIFDEMGILFAHRRITPDICRDKLNSEWKLPPGRYSVIAVGNQDDRSRAYDERTGSVPVKGQTHRDDMRLTLDNAATLAGGSKGDSERLYHGYRTFTVRERGISRVRVDMVNAHMRLRFRVRWKNGATPPTGVDYYAALETVPGEYALMPQYIYPKTSFSHKVHDPATDDEYLSDDDGVVHHIPYTCYAGLGEPDMRNRLTHRVDTRVTVDKELWGEFITYRVKMAADVKLRIARAEDDVLIVPKVIDLNEYFDWFRDYYDGVPDYTLKQDYRIDITIDGNQITMMPVNVSDYDEGGSITGRPRN